MESMIVFFLVCFCCSFQIQKIKFYKKIIYIFFILIEKKNNNKEIQFFKNNTIIQNKKISNIIFYEDFEKECKRDAISYQNGIGLFFRSKKTGLYTSHFSVILRKDNLFANDIIHKMPQYYCNVK